MGTTEEKKNWVAIRCPYCGWDYLPAEIFYPDDFTGRTEQVVQDGLGKIIYVEWKEGYEPTFVQHYECPNCGNKFVVEAALSYKVRREDEALDFKNLEVSLID